MDLGVPLAEMDEGDVRHSTRAAQVSDLNYRFTRRGRSRAGGDRLHLGLLVAPHTAKPPRGLAKAASHNSSSSTSTPENERPNKISGAEADEKCGDGNGGPDLHWLRPANPDGGLGTRTLTVANQLCVPPHTAKPPAPANAVCVMTPLASTS